MTSDRFFETFYAIIEDKLGVDITPDNLDMGTSLHEGFNVDSLDFLELILEFEKVFEITIPDSDVNWSEKMTLGDLVKLVSGKIEGGLDVSNTPINRVTVAPAVAPVVEVQQKFVLEKFNNAFKISDGTDIKTIKAEQKVAYVQATKLFAQLEQFYAQPGMPVKVAPGKSVKPASETAEKKAKEAYEKALKLKDEINSKSKENQK
ncbi:MAG: acyl carrier protein [Alphaproteobacteria bacterium]|nr:acyl carrier protein [Alphaproteobacteria bacterium]